jgi:hypothetical protein
MALSAVLGVVAAAAVSALVIMVGLAGGWRAPWVAQEAQETQAGAEEEGAPRHRR